jgi:hypothetical protein
LAKQACQFVRDAETVFLFSGVRVVVPLRSGGELFVRQLAQPTPVLVAGTVVDVSIAVIRVEELCTLTEALPLVLK